MMSIAFLYLPNYVTTVSQIFDIQESGNDGLQMTRILSDKYDKGKVTNGDN